MFCMHSRGTILINIAKLKLWQSFCNVTNTSSLSGSIETLSSPRSAENTHLSIYCSLFAYSACYVKDNDLISRCYYLDASCMRCLDIVYFRCGTNGENISLLILYFMFSRLCIKLYKAFVLLLSEPKS